MNGKIQFLHCAIDEWGKNFKTEYPPSDFSRELLDTTEKILDSDNGQSIDQKVWHEYLNYTSSTGYLTSLAERNLQYRWAETTFRIVRLSNFTLKNLFDYRTVSNASRTLFYEIIDSEHLQWSYESISARLQAIAAVFYKQAPLGPRVAILSHNCVDSASCDLACLLYDIFVTPLNVYFDSDVLSSILTC